MTRSVNLKKFIIIPLMFAVLVLVMVVSASAAELAYGAATVSASSLNIRSGPSTSNSVITAVIEGTRMVVLDTGDGQWYHVNYQGTEGYVDSTYLKDVLTVENFTATGTLTATDVNVRSKPSTSGSVLRKVTKGDEVQVIGINNGWYKIVYSGTTGYVRSDYIEITGAPNGSAGTTSSSSLGQQIANYAMQYLGYKYVYGGASPSTGFDCSGLVYYVYGQFGYSISRTASQQYKNNGVSISKSELQPGDLVFFSSNGGSSVTHVGIYIGGNQFIHASTSNTGVIISDLNSSYYLSVWYGAKRIV